MDSKQWASDGVETADVTPTATGARDRAVRGRAPGDPVVPQVATQTAGSPKPMLSRSVKSLAAGGLRRNQGSW